MFDVQTSAVGAGYRALAVIAFALDVEGLNVGRAVLYSRMLDSPAGTQPVAVGLCLDVRHLAVLVLVVVGIGHKARGLGRSGKMEVWQKRVVAVVSVASLIQLLARSPQIPVVAFHRFD
jgi:hypothetical protein